MIGDHPHLLQSYEYKYITSCNIKDNEDGTYLYMKYNGDPVKIMGLDKPVYEDILNYISK